jgi:ferric-dicitrate binding protein FerR (iron transport regulator)
MNTAEKINHLFEKDHWSETDKQWILQYLETTDNAELRSLMEERFNKDLASNIPHPDAERLLSLIHQKINEAGAKARFFSLKNTSANALWKQLSVAASIILIIATGTFLFFNKPNQKDKLVAVNRQQGLKNDIAPGHDNAILTLANGATIVLDSASNGELAQEGSVKVLKMDGQVSYAGNDAAGQVVYNTMSTARGNQYQLQLADGSKVWLNAASSIRFPTVFTGNERRVEISGEAYFEVAHDAAKPFTVTYTATSSGEKGEVQVLGTHFNINSYADEAEVKTTLAEGKVKVTQAAGSVLLAPSEEAVFSKSGNELIVKPADVEEAIAWKTGMFEFHDADIQNIMRQLSRWYDVDVNFSGPISGKLFNGSIRRKATLSQALEILKLAGVAWSLQGKTVTIQTR